MPDVSVSIGHPADGGLPKRVADTAEAIGRLLLPAIGRFYTMAREREVHAGFLLPGMAIATPVATVADDDDDDGLF